MPRFPPRGPRGRSFPRFHGTIEALRLPAGLPAALRFLRLAVPREHSPFVRSARGSAPPPSLELVTRYLQPGFLPRQPAGSPKFLGNLHCPSAMFLDSGRTACSRPSRAAAWPRVEERPRLPRETDFRSWITWLLDWLSTPRSAGCPDATQDSLPGAGQALLDGLSTRKVPLKGFRNAILTSHPPFPSFAWRKPLLYSSLKNRCEQRRGSGTYSSGSLRFLLSGILNLAAIRLSKATSNYWHLAD
jgi:hypothetical protein